MLFSKIDIASGRSIVRLTHSYKDPRCTAEHFAVTIGMLLLAGGFLKAAHSPRLLTRRSLAASRSHHLLFLNTVVVRNILEYLLKWRRFSGPPCAHTSMQEKKNKHRKLISTTETTKTKEKRIIVNKSCTNNTETAGIIWVNRLDTIILSSENTPNFFFPWSPGKFQNFIFWLGSQQWLWRNFCDAIKWYCLQHCGRILSHR